MATERRTALPARLQSHILMSCLGSRPFQAVDAAATLCQPGRKEVAAGYVLYGSSTVFVVTTGQGVDMFVLDPMIESFVLVISLKPHVLLRTFPPETLMLPSADIW